MKDEAKIRADREIIARLYHAALPTFVRKTTLALDGLGDLHDRLVQKAHQDEDGALKSYMICGQTKKTNSIRATALMGKELLLSVPPVPVYHCRVAGIQFQQQTYSLDNENPSHRILQIEKGYIVVPDFSNLHNNEPIYEWREWANICDFLMNFVYQGRGGLILGTSGPKGTAAFRNEYGPSFAEFAGITEEIVLG